MSKEPYLGLARVGSVHSLAVVPQRVLGKPFRVMMRQCRRHTQRRQFMVIEWPSAWEGRLQDLD